MFTSKPKELIATGSNASIIGAGVTLKGEIISTADIRIDGKVIGNIRSAARVLIGADGVVEGDIEGMQADIMGTVIGNLRIKELLSLKANGMITGNIQTGKLQMEPSFTFNGQCNMSNAQGNVRGLIKDIHEQPKTATK